MLGQFDLAETLLRLPAILFALSIHEFSHAYTATKFGDETPGQQGRLTLNPMAHIDLIGFVLLMLAGFGWAKPVMINPASFKNPRRDEIIVSVAGPLSNILSAIFFGVILKLVLTFGQSLLAIENLGKPLFVMLLNFITINVGLAVFNILPIPPLDGSHLISASIPDKYLTVKINILKYGSVALIGLILIEMVFNIHILPIWEIVKFLVKLLFGILGIG